MKSRDQARRIAAEYEAAHRPFDCVGIGEAKDFSESRCGALAIYNVSNEQLAECWIVFAKQKSMNLQSSNVILVSKLTGEIVYAGAGGDEG